MIVYDFSGIYHRIWSVSGKIVIEDHFSWFDYGLGHLNFTKNLVLFLFTFQVKARKLCNFNNHAAFSRNHHYVVNNSG